MFGPATGGGGGGGQPALVFASAWDTGTGSTDAALRDTGSTTPWTEAHNGSTFQLINVVSASGLGFPAGMTNVLKFEYNNEDSAECRAENIWTLPAVGSSIWYRIYYRIDVPDGFTTPNASHHGIEPVFGNCPGIWEFKIGPGDPTSPGAGGANKDQNNTNLDATHFCFDLNFNAGSSFWRSPTLTKGTVYQWRWQIKRETSTTMSFQNLEVRSASGTLIGGPSDFICPNNGRTFAQDNPSNTADFTSGPTPPSTTGDANECLQTLTCGQNGPSTWNVTHGTANGFGYVGGVAVSKVGDPGNYVAGEHA